MVVGHITHSSASAQPYNITTKSRRRSGITSDSVIMTRDDSRGDGDDTLLNLYSADQNTWKLGPNSRGEYMDINSTGSSSSNGIATANSLSNSSSPSSLLPSYHSSNSIDHHHHHHLESGTDVHRVLYQDFAEIIPLLESFMDRQNDKSFTRHNAALVYTPSPPLTKGRYPSKGVKDRGQMSGSCKRSVTMSKDSAFWDNAEDSNNINYGVISRRSSLSSSTMDHRRTPPNRNKTNIVADLQCRIEELEQKLKEKEDQLQGVESAREMDMLNLQTRVDEMRTQIIEQEKDIQLKMDTLKNNQNEIVNLSSLLTQAEVEVQESKLSVEKVRQELHSLQRNVATFLVRMQTISSTQPENDDTFNQVEIRSSNAKETKENGQMYDLEMDKCVELMRRRYIACLIAAKENPSEELLLLTTQLRGQLQSYLIKTTKLLM